METGWLISCEIKRRSLWIFYSKKDEARSYPNYKKASLEIGETAKPILQPLDSLFIYSFFQSLFIKYVYMIRAGNIKRNKTLLLFKGPNN